MDTITIVKHKCYLCKEVLSASSVRNYFVCRHCPRTSLRSSSVLWRHQYSIMVEDVNVINRFVWIAPIKKWIEVWSNKKITKITSDYGALICKMDYVVNIDQFNPSQLGEKINTWILLQ